MDTSCKTYFISRKIKVKKKMTKGTFGETSPCGRTNMIFSIGLSVTSHQPEKAKLVVGWPFNLITLKYCHWYLLFSGPFLAHLHDLSSRATGPLGIL